METKYRITITHEENIDTDNLVDYAERVINIAANIQEEKPIWFIYDIGGQLGSLMARQMLLNETIRSDPPTVTEDQIFAYFENLEILAATILKTISTSNRKGKIS